MGGRGASSGVSVKGKAYGSEYTTLLKDGNIKFVRYNDSAAAKTPMETVTRNRVYVTVNAEGELKAVTRYDKSGKRYKQIDLSGQAHRIDGERILPHSHIGYVHDEHGTYRPNAKDRELIDKVIKIWNNRHNRQ